MDKWLQSLTEAAVVMIDTMALLVIVVATAYAFVAAIRMALRRNSDGHHRRLAGCVMAAGWWSDLPSSWRPTFWSRRSCQRGKASRAWERWRRYGPSSTISSSAT